MHVSILLIMFIPFVSTHQSNVYTLSIRTCIQDYY